MNYTAQQPCDAHDAIIEHAEWQQNAGKKWVRPEEMLSQTWPGQNPHGIDKFSG
jgi:hypothetical protein